MGTLNLITDAKRSEAAALVKEGISVSCSRLIVPELASDVTTIPPLHYMIRAGDTVPAVGGGGTSDFLGFSYHGLTISHLDALCHQTWNAKLYNGFDPAEVNSETKANVLNIDVAKNGIITRGVMLDIAKVRGVDWLESGEGVFVEDLEAAEKAQNVRLGEGDALMLRLGWYKRRLEKGAPASGRPGLHAETLPWLKERGISIVAGDASQDADPSGYPTIGLPIHRVGIVGMGLWLIDAANCEELAAVCERLNRYEFMFIVAPLRFKNATGSPTNPLAVF
jgi:kynurenine formamidase